MLFLKYCIIFIICCAPNFWMYIAIYGWIVYNKNRYSKGCSNMGKSLFSRKPSVAYEMVAVVSEIGRRSVYGDNKQNHVYLRELDASGKATPSTYMLGFNGNFNQFYDKLNRYVGVAITPSTVGINADYSANNVSVFSAKDISPFANTAIAQFMDNRMISSFDGFKIKGDKNNNKLLGAVEMMNPAANNVSLQRISDNVLGDTYDVSAVASVFKRQMVSRPYHTSKFDRVNKTIDGQPIMDSRDISSHYRGRHSVSERVSRMNSHDTQSAVYTGKHFRELPNVDLDFAGSEALEIG